MSKRRAVIIISDDESDTNEPPQVAKKPRQSDVLEENETKENDKVQKSKNEEKETKRICPTRLEASPKKIVTIPDDKKSDAVFEKFLSVCRLKCKTWQMEVILKKANGYYQKAKPEYKKSLEFQNLVNQKTLCIDNDPRRIFVYIKDVVDEIKIRRMKCKSTTEVSPDQKTSHESSEVEKKAGRENGEVRPDIAAIAARAEAFQKERKIRKLSHAMKKVDKVIRRLEEREVNFDDDNDSAYIKLERRLVKNYTPKKKDEEDYQYSPCRAFKHVMTEINDLAGQHEVIAENLQSNVIREVTILVKDFKEERKKHLQEGARMMSNLSTQIGALDRARKNYEKAFKEAERALDNFQRADADLNLSRAEVEKQRMNMAIKSQQCEETKNEYANQLQKTNDLQAQHYHTMMPDVFHQLQELDEKRIKNIKNFMIQSVDIERNVFPIISKCLDGIVRAAEQINEKEDTQLVIDRYKSGFQPPEDIPFEDLSAIKSGEAPAPVTSVAITSIRPEAMTVKGTMSAGKIKKRVGLFGIFSSNKNNFSSYGENKEDYSDLPPNQRKKKLQLRVEDITAKIQQETAARDGLMKMKGVYEQNPALGDPMSIEGQLNESGHKLDKLRLELQKYQGYLEEAIEGINNKSGQQSGVVLSVSPSVPSRRNKGVAPGHHLNGGHLHRHHRNSGGSGGEEDSLSRSASDSSVSNPALNHKQSAPGTPLPSHGPESGLGTSHNSLPDSDPEHADSDPQGQAGSDYCDGEVLPALGICRALYPFEATSEGSIPMHDGEELHIIELDQGDGWTRVRRQTDMEEGFVPTSYIECTLYNSC